jgi:arsenate reductase (glutaredoxin)
MLVVYGIKNCDSVKKARLFLEHRNIDYRFHDFRSDGLEAALLQDFIKRAGALQLLNQRSNSWRQLPAHQKSNVTAENVSALMLSLPTLIKRPIVDTGEQLIVGFHPDQYPIQ